MFCKIFFESKAPLIIVTLLKFVFGVSSDDLTSKTVIVSKALLAIVYILMRFLVF